MNEIGTLFLRASSGSKGYLTDPPGHAQYLSWDSNILESPFKGVF